MAKNTKHILGESLKKFLQKKPLNKITVTEIVEDCGLNRMTFYYHFQDIYDLLRYVCVEDTQKAVDGRHSYSNWKEGLLNVFELIRENKAFVMHAYHSLSRDYLELFIYKMTDTIFIRVIDELDTAHALSPKDKGFIASFYMYAFLGVTLNWVDNGMKEDPRDIIERLSILVEGDIANAVERFSNR